MGAGLQISKAVSSTSKEVTNVVTSAGKESAQSELEWAYVHGPLTMSDTAEGDWHIAHRCASYDVKLPKPQ